MGAMSDAEWCFISKIEVALKNHLFRIDACVINSKGKAICYENAAFRFTPLYYSALRGWRVSVQRLISQGADVSVTSRDLYTPLHAAASENHCEVAKLLLDAGAQVDTRDQYGCTALGYIAFYDVGDLFRMSKLLVSRGASPDIRDDEGISPREAVDIHNGYDKRRTAALLAGVHAAGGWLPYVAAPRNELVEFRRQLPSLQRGPSSVPAHVERLFSDKKVPEDVFKHVLAFWCSARDY